MIVYCFTISVNCRGKYSPQKVKPERSTPSMATNSLIPF